MTEFDREHILVASHANGSAYMAVSASLEDTDHSTAVQDFFTDLQPGDTVQLMTLAEYRAGAWREGVAA
jgi:hypothetical protein